jgi:hypothetical protein
MTAFSKYAARTQRLYCEQLERDAREVYECRLVSTDILMTATPQSHPEMGSLCAAFMRWAAVTVKTKPGEGPHCITCDTEFGPGRAIPAAFWFQFPYACPSVVVIEAVCDKCIAEQNYIDRIIGPGRIIPMPKQ